MGVRVAEGIFREYDIRGVAGEELTPETARLISLAFAQWQRDREAAGEPRRLAAVGRDNRLSSPGLAAGAARGFQEAGWVVEDLGVVPTPVFYWAKQRRGYDAGVMVTGSHNEARYNGLKLAWGPGTLYGEDIRDIGRRVLRLAEGEAASAGRGEAGATEARAGEGGTGSAGGEGGGAGEGGRSLDTLEEYLSDVLGRIGGRAARGRRLRVVVDCGSGTAGLVAPTLFERLGHEVIPLWCELDGTFPGHWPDPVKAENLAALREAVVSGGADVGLAFDGDADRLGVVDETGEILWGDLVMILFWREILARHPGAEAIVEVKCSQALVDEIRRLGGRPLFCRTGHSLIKAKMREIGAVFAGEMSGHMFFADEYYGFDDALYAAARLLRILARSERPLSALLADRPRYFSTPEVRIPCPDDIKFEAVERIRRRFSGQGLEIVEVDGVRVHFPDGSWLLVRASNTQPALVARCEARTPERLEEVRRQAVAALRQAGVAPEDLEAAEIWGP